MLSVSDRAVRNSWNHAASELESLPTASRALDQLVAMTLEELLLQP